MLPEKAWRADAILRLFLSVVVCYFAGAFLIAALQFGGGPSFSAAARFYALLIGSILLLGVTLAMLMRRWELQDSLVKVAATLFCFYAGLTLGAFAARMAGVIQPSVTQMIVSSFSLQGALLLFAGPFIRGHELSWSEAFGLKNHPGRAILAGMAVGCMYLPVGLLLQAASAHLMTWLHLAPAQQQVVQTLQVDKGSAGRALFGVITILLVPPAEECFFRGILYRWIKSSGFPVTALWATSLLFGVVHWNLASFVPLTLFAAALALLYAKTGNLLAPIAAHAFFNAANLAALYYLEHVLK